MAEAEKKSGSKGNVLKIIIIILLAVVLLGGGTFAGYFFASKGNPSPANTNTANTTNTALSQRTFSLDEFLVNLQSDGSARYLKAQIYVGYPDVEESADIEAELDANKAIIRDAINTVLRSKKPEDFTEAGVKKLKEEIKAKVNPLLKQGQILDVYFYEIIIQ